MSEIYYRDLPQRLSLTALQSADPQLFPCLLAGADGDCFTDRYEFLFCASGEYLELNEVDSQLLGNSGHEVGKQFLPALDRWFQQEADLDALPKESHVPEWPFLGGWVIYLGYELAAEIEPRLHNKTFKQGDMPAALAIRSDAAVVRDKTTEEVWLVAESEARLDALSQVIDENTIAAESYLSEPVLPIVSSDSAEKFLHAVSYIQEYIRAGDVFQVNFSRQWSLDWRPGDTPKPHALYEKISAGNPAPFSGLLLWRDWAVVSSSPERLLNIRNSIIETRPIAGTRARNIEELDQDKAIAEELLNSHKDQSEHIMLLDMERNDLGRVCVTGSVEVTELMALKQYQHVQHLESTVRGVLREDVTPGQAIAATFPGGSITGCPKVRCMEIIAELEQEARGFYTGSLGYLSRNGDMDLNILIRSMSLHGNRAVVRAGAGIVADSNAAAELKESNLKADSVLAAFHLTTDD